MIWFLVILIGLWIIAFMCTWSAVYAKADHGQYAATCRRFDEYCSKVDALVNDHSGYGPTAQHMPALDQIVTLQLYPAAPGGKGDGHFYIPSPDMYKTGYNSCAEAAAGAPMRSMKRSVTLRELLNRLLKDIPVELVHAVEQDWKFKDEPKPDLFSIGLHLIVPPPTIDNRAHPLDPPLELAPQPARFVERNPISLY